MKYLFKLHTANWRNEAAFSEAPKNFFLKDNKIQRKWTVQMHLIYLRC